jgi:hypothetical protein
LHTPKAKQILRTTDYLVEKYGLEVYSSVTEYSTSIYLTMKNLTGLKDERLASMLESLVYSEPDTSSTGDSPSSFSRQYTFRWYGEEDESYNHATLTISVTASFSEDSETCKRVIVGYREPDKEPTPIYELKCVEDAPQE